jgi:hypothetical protein
MSAHASNANRDAFHQTSQHRESSLARPPRVDLLDFTDVGHTALLAVSYERVQMKYRRRGKPLPHGRGHSWFPNRDR